MAVRDPLLAAAGPWHVRGMTSVRTAIVLVASVALFACREAPLPNAPTRLPTPTPERLAALHVPLRIVAIGDSITQGRRGRTGPGTPEGPVVSYRHPFFREVVRSGHRVDMVGTLAHGFEGDPAWPPVDGVPFDPDHEARWGITLHEAIERVDVALRTLEPDVALVHLGDTDVGDGVPLERVFEDWARFLAMLRRHRPDIGVVLATDCNDFGEFPAYRRRLRASVRYFTTARSPVAIADACEGWVSDPGSPRASTIDWVHPSTRGDEALARAFFRAVEPWLVRSVPSAE